jgi:pyruvate dehydrogenase E1 component alpha subunit
MIAIRTFENGVRKLINEGKLEQVSFYTGGEAVAAAVGVHLKKEDQIGSTHRPLGHLIAKGADINKMMAELAGKVTGTNKGKGGAYHIFDAEVGALANQLKGNDNISVSFFGEGASNQGGVQETLNLAACWKLPIVFICENSSPGEQTMLGHKIDYPQLSIADISLRAPSYGIPGKSHNGWEVEPVYNIIGEAVDHARQGNGPTLLEFKIHRLLTSNENTYCPIKLYNEKLIKEGILTKKMDSKIIKLEANRVKQAIDFAISSPEPEIMDAFIDIFVENMP